MWNNVIFTPNFNGYAEKLKIHGCVVEINPNLH